MFVPPDATPPAQTGELRHRTPSPTTTQPPPPGAPRRCAAAALPARECRVSDARRFARALLASWGVTGDDLDSAVLIVGEPAANAARHGRADMAIILVLTDRVLSVGVVDSGEPNERPPPMRRRRTRSRPGHRGTPRRKRRHPRGTAPPHHTRHPAPRVIRIRVEPTPPDTRKRASCGVHQGFGPVVFLEPGIRRRRHRLGRRAALAEADGSSGALRVGQRTSSLSSTTGEATRRGRVRRSGLRRTSVFGWSWRRTVGTGNFAHQPRL
ncbi:ATP-binding protein [Embleya sp. NPDC050154]|uniref:ATP-binding protein n=1 Tax=unclassified Embleya TaxID=2699296 RepID=UPI0037B5983E